MSPELCRCRQAGCSDPDTEVRRRRFLDELERATKPQTVPVNRIRWAFTTSTATSTFHTF